LSGGVVSTRISENDFSVYMEEGQPTHYNGAQEVYVELTAGGGVLPEGLWRLRVAGQNVVDGRFEAWLPTEEQATRRTAFSRPSAECTVTLPGTAEAVITAGGYNADINGAAAFSGRGCVGAGSVKPDLVAPAVGIYAPKNHGGYDTYTGTSMAAPFVTGAAALMMEWGIVRGNDPFLYGRRVKAYLQKGAQRFRDDAYPNEIWGYGTLCIRNTLDLLRR
jgi:hypothetical protein